MANEPYDVLILGSGPAGGTAAIYTARANLRTLLVTGPTPGGQVMATSEIDNFPGFPEGVQGPALGQLVEKQARRFGAEFAFDVVTSADLTRRPFVLHGDETEYRARALIICTGSSPRRLDIPAEKQFVNRGLSYCATCDGRFFMGKTVAVIGGGDAALEDACYLAHLAAKVYVIHRRSSLRAGPQLQTRAHANLRIEFVWDSVVEDLTGDETGLKGLTLSDVQSHAERSLEVQGVFVAVGQVPNASLFKNQLDLDWQGYIVADKLTHTKVPGVFAAGDVADPHFRQAVTAAGTGCAAAMEAVRYIEALEE
jgi:thioredoxin reductase (NADPH)